MTSKYLYGQGNIPVQATGGWNVSVPATAISEAGLNYTANITSAANQTLLDIDLKGNTAFTITIIKQDTDWNASLTLWAQRTGPQSGGPAATLTGGLNYIQLANTAQYLFNGSTGNGSGKVLGIPIRYEIRGLSVLIPVKAYTTTVVYTITTP